MISVIVRVKNEEPWIRHSLEAVFSQSGEEFEVIVVNNRSEDQSMKIVESFPVREVVELDQYSPGRALNEGIRVARGSRLAFLSAHCIPTDELWLTRLSKGLSDERIAGVYGRQLPMSFTHQDDAADLEALFGQDMRLQKKDYFFHNANSIIRKSIWNDIPFDEETPNVEDRLWGKAVIEEGWRLLYEPDAPVYHHNGLHSSTDRERRKSVISVLHNKVPKDSGYRTPKTWDPRRAKVIPLITLPKDSSPSGVPQHIPPEHLLSQLESSSELKLLPAVVLSSGPNTGSKKFHEFSRESIPNCDALSLENLIGNLVLGYEKNGEIPDYYLYLNSTFQNRPPQLVDRLVDAARQRNFSFVFAAERDYADRWTKREDSGEIEREAVPLLPRASKALSFRAIYGLGSLISANQARSSQFFTGKTGLLEVTRTVPEDLKNERFEFAD